MSRLNIIGNSTLLLTTVAVVVPAPALAALPAAAAAAPTIRPFVLSATVAEAVPNIVAAETAIFCVTNVLVWIRNAAINHSKAMW